MDPRSVRYVVVNTESKPSQLTGSVAPFLTRTVDGRELPVHATAGECNGKALGVLAGMGLLVPAPEGLDTVPLNSIEP